MEVSRADMELLCAKDIAVEMYKNGYPLQEIADEVHLDKSYISKLARKAGCAPRVNKSSHKKTKSSKKRCPKCHHMYTSDSNFCSNCGADVRTQEKLLIVEIEWLRANICWLRDDDDKKRADTLTRNLLKYLSDNQ